jgi:hypothetical protein
VSCPQEPLPEGWRIFRGSVPAALGQFAVDALARINSYEYGDIAGVTEYNGVQVAAFKSHHTFTWRKGKLVTGLCIPGISLIVSADAAIGLGVFMAGHHLGSKPYALAATSDPTTPDPMAAMYSVDNPPETTDWKLVATTAAITVSVVGLFLWGMHAAGRTSSRKALR